MTESELLTVAEAADELCLTVRGVTHRIKKGQITATKFGSGKTSPYVITRAELERVKTSTSPAAVARAS